MTLGASDRDELKRLGASKRIVTVLVKWRHPFLTKLEDFRKPSDAGLIGIFAEQIRPKLLKEHEQHFDKIFWFHADYSTFASIFDDTNKTNVPEVTECVKQICSVIPPTKLCLLESEEFLLDQICRLREQFGIPGIFQESQTDQPPFPVQGQLTLNWSIYVTRLS